MTGSPLSTAVLGVSSLKAAKDFYGGVIGLEASDPVTLSGPGFETHWNLPLGSAAEAILFWYGDDPVGQVLAIKFSGENRVTIPQPGDRTYRGLWNLNFYVDDIRATTKDLQAKGYTFWSEPVGYEVSAKAGQPVEVLFDGLDGLAVNLVELTGDDSTAVGKLRQQVDAYGKTPTGFTPVATTSHSITDHEKALAFYEKVLGLHVIIDDVLNKPETNHFLGRPDGAETRATFVAGDHPFGKIALSYPMNYSAPDKGDTQVPPNIGYLAQSFIVPDLVKALEICDEIGAERFSDTCDIMIPGVGPRFSAVVRNPGSGALMELVEGVV
jgi:catechol 2,3-dioxygenase-like lactoylglutathione lyase family enzyme